MRNEHRHPVASKNFSSLNYYRRTCIHITFDEIYVNFVCLFMKLIKKFTVKYLFMHKIRLN